MLRRFLPAYIKKPIKAAIRRRQIDSAIREMERFGRAEIERLARVWANEGFAADLEYLGALVNLARSTSGEILECGSGLTTIILGKLRKPVTTLENHPEWYQELRTVLERHQLHTVRLHHVPFRHHTGFDWYDAPMPEIPFSLVVCDGQPSSTHGGRYGLLPIMHSYLRGSTILLDDSDRRGEQQALERWTKEFGVNVAQVSSESGSYAIVKVPE
jgi:hypothetical protein